MQAILQNGRNARKAIANNFANCILTAEEPFCIHLHRQKQLADEKVISFTHLQHCYDSQHLCTWNISKRHCEEKAQSIGFMNITNQMANPSTRADIDENVDINEGTGQPVTIFHAKIGRKKYDCEKGFGLCDITIFGIKLNSVTDGDDKYPSPDYTSGFVSTNPNGIMQADFLLSKTPESVGLTEMPTFNIDEQIETAYQKGDSTITIIIPAGKYQYNNSLGINGGYRILLESQNN